MKEKNILKKSILFQAFQADAFKEYLEEMALKGWLLKEAKKKLVFEKVEPKKVIYSVEINDLPYVNKKNPVPIINGIKEAYKEQGWLHLGDYSYFSIFVAEKNDALPVITDQKNKLTAVKKVMRRINIDNIIKIFLFLLIFFMQGFTRIITNYIAILFILVWLFTIFIDISIFIKYRRWRKAALNSIKKDEIIPTLGITEVRKYRRILLWSSFIVTFLWIVLTAEIYFKSGYEYDRIIITCVTLICIFFSLLSYITLKNYYCEKTIKYNYNYILNVLITIMVIASFVLTINKPESSEPTITLENIVEGKLSGKIESVYTCSNYWACHSKGLLFAPDKGDSKYIEYSVFKSELPFTNRIFAFEKMHYLGSKKYIEEDASKWGAIAVYNNQHDITIVVYDDVVFVYDSQIKLDENDITYIKTTLGVLN